MTERPKAVEKPEWGFMLGLGAVALWFSFLTILTETSSRYEERLFGCVPFTLALLAFVFTVMIWGDNIAISRFRKTLLARGLAEFNRETGELEWRERG